MSSVKVNWVTPEPEWWMEYIARQSAPINQKKMEDGELEPRNLLIGSARRKHWSVFQHAYASVTVTCKLLAAIHLLRHQSFDFQMFSQRYAKAGKTEEGVKFRLEHPTNRQASIEIPTDPVEAMKLGLSVYDLNALAQLEQEYQDAMDHAHDLYERALKLKVAKESAREVLPIATPTSIVMTGSVRSWIHFLEVRTDRSVVQKETADVADQIQKLLAHHLPLTAEAFNWKGTDDEAEPGGAGSTGSRERGAREESVD